uniref:Reverse transcriptase domain-containing protein n=1 Tax=Tanacetum cinerariifolium TaxID=118510 RepID=A0A6L2MDE5_TANCI|nr:hypothetical protein [Tanacetum cinerariifolium]
MQGVERALTSFGGTETKNVYHVVPEPEYLEYLVPSDAEAPMEDLSLPDKASLTTPSPGYVVAYHTDGGDDVDDESFDDDNDDDDDDDDDVEEDEDDKEEEHLSSADSSVVPTVDHVPSAEDTKAFDIDESAPTHVPSPRRRTARMSIQPHIPMSDTVEALITEYASAPTPPSPPPSLLSPLSSPLLQILSPPLHVPSPPLPLLSLHMDDRPEADMPLQKRAHFTAPAGRFEVEESSSPAAARQAGHTLARTVDYVFIDTMDASISAAESRAMTVVEVVNDRRIRDEDRLTAHIQYEHDRFRDLVHAIEAGPQDGPEDVGSSFDDALAERDADRGMNGDDSHDSGSDERRRMHVARECTYSDFLKCQPLNFKESDEVEKYVCGLPDMIHGSVMASKPNTMQDTIEFATELMDQKIRTLAERQAKNKRKFEDTSRNNQNQQ